MTLAINRNFYKIPNKIFKLGLSKNEILVLSYLFSYYTLEEIHPSVRTIARECGLSSTNVVIKTIKSLKNKNIVDYIPGRKGMCNTYKIILENIDPRCVINKKTNTINFEKIFKEVESFEKSL